MESFCSSSSSLLTKPSLHGDILPNPNQTSSDLPATISIIKNLTNLAKSTLESIHKFLSFAPPSSSSHTNLARCPFDSRHIFPPEKLFRHSLTCSSAPGSPILDLGFLDKIQYHRSLKSEEQILKENRFVRILSEAESDICFSLEGDLGEICSNFFYKDCPGVVTCPEFDATSRTFTLPAILSAECANFVNFERDGDFVQNVGILPSDFWVLRSEVESWSDFPVAYSFATVLVAAGLHRVDEIGLRRWVILNSPMFGILIDAAIRDHVFLLLKLCLKAVRREAVWSVRVLLEGKGFVDPRIVRCECPRLVCSLTWLVTQISVLYGELNGKFFVMGMLKESFLSAGRCLMFNQWEKDGVSDDKNVFVSGSDCSGRECKLELCKPAENLDFKVQKPCEISNCSKVFVSQVASAIAAFHERYLLEQRVRAMRFAQPLARSQRLNDYISTSIRASQERAKRPKYRALLEHDGLLWQRSNNQESGKFKTREELLADERDYKRRRMSYRGKKLKRNPMQVLHDIIEEHMEEIKLAGGIGCNVKMASESTIVPKLERERNKALELQCSSNDAYEVRIKKSLHYEGSLTRKDHEYGSSYDGSITYEDHNKFEKNKRGAPSHGSRSPSYDSGYSQSSERYSQLRPTRDNYDRRGSNYPPSYKDYDSRSTLTTKSLKASKNDYNCVLESRRSYGSRASEKQFTDSRKQDMFEERYEPSRSPNRSDIFYEGASGGSHNHRARTNHTLKSDSEHYDAKKKYSSHISCDNRDHHK